MVQALWRQLVSSFKKKFSVKSQYNLRIDSWVCIPGRVGGKGAEGENFVQTKFWRGMIVVVSFVMSMSPFRKSWHFNSATVKLVYSWYGILFYNKGKQTWDGCSLENFPANCVNWQKSVPRNCVLSTLRKTLERMKLQKEKKRPFLSTLGCYNILNCRRSHSDECRHSSILAYLSIFFLYSCVPRSKVACSSRSLEHKFESS